MKKRTLLRAALTALSTGAATLGASAAQEAFPQRPIRVVLGFSAGGGTDVIARALAQKMTEALGVAVVVDNRPGANGNLGAELVAKALPDGYTLLYNTSSIVLSPGLYARLGYDVLKDFTPVGMSANMPIVLVANPQLPVQNVQALVQNMKSAPGRLDYASAGSGNITHFSMLLFEQAVGVKGTHIPYRGEAPALTDLMGGQVALYMGTSAGVLPAIQSGRIRALAVASPKRLAFLPDVPTVDETVSKGFEAGAWSGLLAPAGTPAAVVQRLNQALRAALDTPDLQAKFAANGAEVRYASSEQYARFMRSELSRWSAIGKQYGVKVD